MYLCRILLKGLIIIRNLLIRTKQDYKEWHQHWSGSSWWRVAVWVTSQDLDHIKPAEYGVTQLSSGLPAEPSLTRNIPVITQWLLLRRSPAVHLTRGPTRMRTLSTGLVRGSPSGWPPLGKFTTWGEKWTEHSDNTETSVGRERTVESQEKELEEQRKKEEAEKKVERPAEILPGPGREIVRQPPTEVPIKTNVEKKEVNTYWPRKMRSDITRSRVVWTSPGVCVNGSSLLITKLQLILIIIL